MLSGQVFCQVCGSWTGLLCPDLVFWDGDIASVDEFVHFAEMVLLLRTTPIRKVSVTTDAEVSRALNRWMVMLSRNKIEEAEFMLDPSLKCQIPFSLFTCVYLKKLQLSGCTVKLPLRFKGFEMLTDLILAKFSASDSGLEGLICSCPLLKVLSLQKFIGVCNLTICAPYLRRLKIGGQFRRPNLQPPNLFHACIRLTRFVFKEHMELREGTSNFISAFGCCLRSIAEVILHHYAMTYLGVQFLEDKVSQSFDNLVHISMHINAKCPLETAAALRIIENAPKIEYLHIHIHWAQSSILLKSVHSAI